MLALERWAEKENCNRRGQRRKREMRTTKCELPWEEMGFKGEKRERSTVSRTQHRSWEDKDWKISTRLSEMLVTGDVSKNSFLTVEE